jgi:hypothetical protein
MIISIYIIFTYGTYTALNPLNPVLSRAYIATDSESPEQSNAGSFVSGVIFASISTPEIFFRLVEDLQVFEEVKPCICHIADAAMYKELDGDMENRFYFSQDLHSMFDGRQTTVSYTGMEPRGS